MYHIFCFWSFQQGGKESDQEGIQDVLLQPDAAAGVNPEGGQQRDVHLQSHGIRWGDEPSAVWQDGGQASRDHDTQGKQQAEISLS